MDPIYIRIITKNPALGEIFVRYPKIKSENQKLFFCFFMHLLFSAVLAPFLQFYLAFNFFLILSAPVVHLLAFGAGQTDEIVLRHD